MKKILLFISTFFAFSQFLKSQTTYTANFENGIQKKVTFEYDDPSLISKFRMGVAFGMDVPKAAVLTFILHPEYRINERLLLEGLFRFPFSRSIDGNIPEAQIDNKYFKTFNNLRIIAHYDIFQKIKTKDKNVEIDKGYEGFYDMLYVIEVPRKHSSSLTFDLGINANRVASNLGVSLKDPINTPGDAHYYLGNHRSVSIQTGFSHYKTESYKINTDGVERSFFRMRRIYFNIVYGLVNKADYYKKSSISNFETVSDESILTVPEKKSFGWMFGYSKHLGIKNSGLSIWIGIEIGVLPYMALEGYKDDARLKTPSSSISLHAGLAFGPRPRK